MVSVFAPRAGGLVRVLQRNRPNQGCVCVCVEREREFYFRELLLQWWGLLASPKSRVQVSRLEVQVRIDVSVLNRMAGSSGRTCVLRFSGKIPSSLENLGLGS